MKIENIRDKNGRFIKNHKSLNDVTKLTNWIKENGAWNKGKKCPNAYKNLKEYNKSGKSWNRGKGLITTKEYRLINKTLKNKSIPMSHFVWCSQPENLSHVPKGFNIHHLDGNPKNNNSNNLFLIQRKDHIKLHAKMWRLN